MKYECVKKPVVVYAVQWTGDNFDEIEEFCGKLNSGKLNSENVAYLDTTIYKGDTPLEFDRVTVLMIRTLEGDHEATIGDYIIKGVRNECYPCKRDIFEETYDFKEIKNGK